MLDLSTPMSPVEGLVLYRDHADPSLVYFLPDEVGLRDLGGRGDISLQVFLPGQVVVDGSADLDSMVGSVFSVGGSCTVSPPRLERVRQGVAEQLGTDQFTLAAPPWENGTVQLLLLDSQGGGGEEPAEDDPDRLVRTIAGSRKPSLTDGQLSCLFHARLDQRGSALALAALRGDTGTLAGVLYDLKFAALRPSIDLKMRADLERCGWYLRTGIEFQYAWFKADLTATFDKMKEEGIIEVDVVSYEPGSEAEKQVNECVLDFYEKIMRELFRPTINPSIAAAGTLGSGGSAPSGGAMLTLKVDFGWSEHERIIEVDYRKRSAAVRTHNPQAHLGLLADLGGGADAVVQHVELTSAWREFPIEVAAPAAFDGDHLLEVQAVVWPGDAGVLDPEDARDGGLRMPEGIPALIDKGFTSGDADPFAVLWHLTPDETPSYRWQARVRFASDADIESEPELWCEPRTSTSRDLDLFPTELAPLTSVDVKLTDPGEADGLQRVNVELVARDSGLTEIARKEVQVTPDAPERRWAVRRIAEQDVRLEAQTTWVYAGGGVVEEPVRFLSDRDLLLFRPFISDVSLTPLVVGAAGDALELSFLARYAHEATGWEAERRLRLRPPDFEADEVTVPVLERNALIEWEVLAILPSGETPRVAQGTTEGGTVVVNLQQGRTVTVRWLGPSPDDAGLRWVKVFVRADDGGDEPLEEKLVEFRGATAAETTELSFGTDGRLRFQIERRFEDGTRDRGTEAHVNGDEVLVVN